MALLAILQAQQSPSQAEKTTQQQTDQDQNSASYSKSNSNQTQESLFDAQSGAHRSELELHSAVELQSCASELLHAIASLSTTLSQHQPCEDVNAESLYVAVIQALSGQVRHF